MPKKMKKIAIQPANFSPNTRGRVFAFNFLSPFTSSIDLTISLPTLVKKAIMKSIKIVIVKVPFNKAPKRKEEADNQATSKLPTNAIYSLMQTKI